MMTLSRRLFLTTLLAVPAVAVGIRLPSHALQARTTALVALMKRKLEESARSMSRILERAMYASNPPSNIHGLLEVITADNDVPYGGFSRSETYVPRYSAVTITEYLDT